MTRRSRRIESEADALTPFGRKVRELRAARGLQLKHMAAHLGVSSAYLSALERGERGRPTFTLVQGTIHYFGVIWDDADELQRLAEVSDPNPRIPASGCGADAVLLANRLARDIALLTPAQIAACLDIMQGSAGGATLDGSGPSGSNPGHSEASAPTARPDPDTSRGS